jgi:YegS/Rv2252/BmrU family lipid kinase
MSRYKIILNPASGHGDGGQKQPEIERSLRTLGLAFDLVRTQAPMHAVELARQAVRDGYDFVVAAGGDGTSNEVLNGLIQARQAGEGLACMGVLCVGRGNDFAFSMGIPPGVAAGSQVLAQGRRRTIDVGKVTGGLFPQGRYFGNGVGIGFDAVVGFEAKKITGLTGFPSYVIAALRTIFLYFQAPLVKIEAPGFNHTTPALMVSVMNGIRLGGGFMMAPHGDPEDGIFDLCIARQVSRLRIFTLIPHFIRGTQASQEPIVMSQAKQVVITAQQGVLPAHADGETLATDALRFTVEILPQQLEILTQEKPG